MAVATTLIALDSIGSDLPVAMSAISDRSVLTRFKRGPNDDEAADQLDIGCDLPAKAAIGV